MAARLSTQVGAVVFGRIIVSLIDTLKAFLLVRLLTKDDYGALAFALTWQATAIGLGMLSLPDSLLYFLPRAEQGVRRALVRQTLILLGVIGLSLGAFIALFALIPGAQPFERADMTPALACIGLAVALDLPAGALASFLLGMERHRTSSLIALSLSVIANLALLIPAWLGATPVEILLVYDLVAFLRLAVTWTAWLRVFRGVAAEPFPGGVRAQLGFALPLSLNGLAGLANKYFATYVSGWLLSAASFADFAIGGRELPFVKMIPNAVAIAILPRLSQIAGAGSDKLAAGRAALALWHTSIDRVALVMLPIACYCFVEAEPLLRVLYGANYESAALPFRITTLVLPLRVTSYGHMLLALGKPRAILRSQLAGMAFNALVTAPLIAWAWFGDDVSPGPRTRIAWACAAGIAATYIIVGSMLRDIGRETQFGLRGVFPWPSYARRLALALLATTPLIVWRLFFPDVDGFVSGAAALIGRLLLYAACYLALILSAGLVPPNDRAVIMQWLRLEPLWRRE